MLCDPCPKNVIRLRSELSKRLGNHVLRGFCPDLWITLLCLFVDYNYLSFIILIVTESVALAIIMRCAPYSLPPLEGVSSTCTYLIHSFLSSLSPGSNAVYVLPGMLTLRDLIIM